MKVKVYQSIVLLFFLTILMLGCKKDKKYVWVQYNETWCSDSWYNGDYTENEKKDLVKKYFKERGCDIKTINITEVGAQIPCFACVCQSGLAVKCEIKNEFIETFINEGFFEIEE